MRLTAPIRHCGIDFDLSDVRQTFGIVHSGQWNLQRATSLRISKQSVGKPVALPFPMLADHHFGNYPCPLHTGTRKSFYLQRQVERVLPDAVGRER